MPKLHCESTLMRQAKRRATPATTQRVREVLAMYECAALSADAERFGAAAEWLRTFAASGRALPVSLEIASAMAPVCPTCGEYRTPGQSCGG